MSLYRQEQDVRTACINKMVTCAEAISANVKALDVVIRHNEDYMELLPTINAALDELSNFASILEWERLQLSKSLNSGSKL